METIGDKLRYIRAQKGINQESLASTLNITRSYLSCLESGLKHASPKMETKINIIYDDIVSENKREITQTIQGGTEAYAKSTTNEQLEADMRNSYDMINKESTVNKCWHLHNLSIFASELAKRLEKEQKELG